jgi:hypothetical protein
MAVRLNGHQDEREQGADVDQLGELGERHERGDHRNDDARGDRGAKGVPVRWLEQCAHGWW